MIYILTQMSAGTHQCTHLVLLLLHASEWETSRGSSIFFGNGEVSGGQIRQHWAPGRGTKGCMRMNPRRDARRGHHQRPRPTQQTAALNSSSLPITLRNCRFRKNIKRLLHGWNEASKVAWMEMFDCWNEMGDWSPKSEIISTRGNQPLGSIPGTQAVLHCRCPV